MIVASGPSLTRADVDFVKGKARVMAINTSYKLAPWADVLYAADGKWWRWHHGAPDFHGLKFSVSKTAQNWTGVTVLNQGSESGLSTDPTTLALGHNSGYQAINLAVLFGSTRILLLGYDMARGPKGQHHWHKEHPHQTYDNYQFYARLFAKMVAPLRMLGVEVINCSRQTALTCFPRQSLAEALR